MWSSVTDAEVLVLVLWFQAQSRGLTPAVTSLPAGSVGQEAVNVDLLLDPGGEVGHVAVDAGPQHLAEADAAPGRQAEERPAETLVFLAHQRAAAVALKHTAGSTDGSDPELTY